MGNLLPPLLSTHLETLRLTRQNAIYEAALCLARPEYSALEKVHAEFLHPDEAAYLSTLKYERRRSSYLLGRYCAKQALSRILAETTPTAVAISQGVFTQPVVAGPGARNTQVSISHAGEWGAAIAFPEAHPMAIDIEEAKPDRADVIRSQLTAAECDRLCLMDPDATRALVLLWTVKEAMSKVIRCGMMTPFTIFEVAEFSRVERRYVSTFTNFPQYKATSLFFDDLVLSIVSPKNTTFEIALGKIAS